MKLTHYLWKRPQNRHKCINDINVVFCFIWMKIHLVVFVSYLNLQKCVEKTPQTEKFIYSFLNFIICESLHKGRLSCLVCMVLCLRWQLSSRQYRKQVTTGRAYVTTRDWCWNREMSNWNTCKIMILLVTQVFHFYTGCLGNSKRNWKGNAHTMNKNEIFSLNHTAVSVFCEVSAYTSIYCQKAQFSGKFI